VALSLTLAFLVLLFFTRNLVRLRVRLRLRVRVR